MAFEWRAHIIYDRYGWTPEILEKLTTDQLNRYYELIVEVHKAEEKRDAQRAKSWSRFFSSLLNNFMKAASR